MLECYALLNFNADSNVGDFLLDQILEAQRLRTTIRVGSKEFKVVSVDVGNVPNVFSVLLVAAADAEHELSQPMA